MKVIIKRLQEEVLWLNKYKEEFEMKPDYFKGYLAGIRMSIKLAKLTYKNYKDII